jgi:hypothetical protein
MFENMKNGTQWYVEFAPNIMLCIQVKKYNFFGILL